METPTPAPTTREAALAALLERWSLDADAIEAHTVEPRKGIRGRRRATPTELAAEAVRACRRELAEAIAAALDPVPDGPDVEALRWTLRQARHQADVSGRGRLRTIRDLLDAALSDLAAPPPSPEPASGRCDLCGASGRYVVTEAPGEAIPIIGCGNPWHYDLSGWSLP